MTIMTIMTITTIVFTSCIGNKTVITKDYTHDNHHDYSQNMFAEQAQPRIQCAWATNDSIKFVTSGVGIASCYHIESKEAVHYSTKIASPCSNGYVCKDKKSTLSSVKLRNLDTTSHYEKRPGHCSISTAFQCP